MRNESKFKGELSEAAFLLQALLAGFVVAKPHGDNARYDFIVDNGKRLIKVQVKSTSRLVSQSRYAVTIGRHYHGVPVPYGLSEVDFLAIHVVPHDCWYIMPLAATNGKTMIYLRGHRGGPNDRFATFLGAWDLLQDQERQPDWSPDLNAAQPGGWRSVLNRWIEPLLRSPLG